VIVRIKTVVEKEREQTKKLFLSIVVVVITVVVVVVVVRVVLWVLIASVGMHAEAWRVRAKYVTYAPFIYGMTPAVFYLELFCLNILFAGAKDVIL